MLVLIAGKPGPEIDCFCCCTAASLPLPVATCQIQTQHSHPEFVVTFFCEFKAITLKQADWLQGSSFTGKKTLTTKSTFGYESQLMSTVIEQALNVDSICND